MANEEVGTKGSETLELLLNETEINARVRELGEAITRDYAGKELVIIGVLKGAATFVIDLVREIKLPILMDWMAITTYGKGTIAGNPRLLKDTDLDLAGQHVLVIEDILDSGVTLTWLLDHISQRGPVSIESCVLLRKSNSQKLTVSPSYVGFDISAYWVAGFGIDYAERYRNLRSIHEVNLETLREKNKG